MNNGVKKIINTVCNVAMVLCLIALVVALFLTENVNAFTAIIGIVSGVLVLAFGTMIVLYVLVLTNKRINHRSPEYKNALLNIVVAGICFIVAVLGIVYTFVQIA